MLSSQDVQSQLSRQACLLALLVPKCIIIIQKLIRGKKDANIGNYQVSLMNEELKQLKRMKMREWQKNGKSLK